MRLPDAILLVGGVFFFFSWVIGTFGETPESKFYAILIAIDAIRTIRESDKLYELETS